MGMSVLNLPFCYFVIYASYDNTMHVIKVPHDYEFSKSLLTTVKEKYFQHMVHNLCDM